jgi:hypothetical protein
MFGNPNWFRPKAVGFGIVPTKWQGWAYSVAWGGTIGLPFWLLMARYQSLEALVWLTLATGSLAFDVWQMWTVLRRRSGSAGASPSQAFVTRRSVSCRALD